MVSSKAFLGLRGSALTTAQLLLVVAPAFILFGYNQSNLGGLVSLADWTRVFPTIDTKNTTGHQKSTNATLQGLVIATFTLGALPGCLSCSYTADRFGRRPIIALGALLTLIGEILEASSFHIAQLITGRLILGVGVGMLSGVVPTWQSECSSPHTRGRHVVLSGLFIALGYVLQAWINLGFYQFSAGPLTWRPPISIAGFFSIVLTCCVFLMPESPRWLVHQGRVSEAKAVMSALRDSEETSTDILAEVAAIELSLEEQGGKKARLSDLLKMGEDKLLYRFAICLLLQFFQQMSGGNLISVYSTVIFQNGLGLDAETSRLLSGGALTWKFLSCFVSFFTIDRLGRRIAFMVSGTGMATCMLGLAVATSFPTSNYAGQITSVLFVFLFNFFIPIGFLGANFLYCAEIAPLRLRVAMSSISTANHWLCNFLVTMITPIAIQNIGHPYYILYTVIGFCIPLTVYFLYPETMGMRLEDIDLFFRESPSVWSTVKFAKTRQQRTETEILSDKNIVEHQEKV
ncbi:putative sugar transporter [Pestalotiopsis sp. NC0098]|nr:putative sugar transporter [Pestalotiopsis sp. NC0098]